MALRWRYVHWICFKSLSFSLHRSLPLSGSAAMPPTTAAPSIDETSDILALLDEEHLQLTIQAIQDSKERHANGGPPPLSLQQTEKVYCIPRTTLTARMNGRKTYCEAHELEMNLSQQQEKGLVT